MRTDFLLAPCGSAKIQNLFCCFVISIMVTVLVTILVTGQVPLTKMEIYVLQNHTEIRCCREKFRFERFGIAWQFFGFTDNLSQTAAAPLHVFHAVKQIGNYRIPAYRTDAVDVTLLNWRAFKHSAGRYDLHTIIEHINVNLAAHHNVIAVLCEVNSYAKSLPEPLILWEIRQLLLCINFSILQVVFQPVDQILLLFLSVFMNCFYRYAMLLQLFFLNPWIRFRIDFRCDY